jgi:hypothetical protein
MPRRGRRSRARRRHHTRHHHHHKSGPTKAVLLHRMLQANNDRILITSGAVLGNIVVSAPTTPPPPFQPFVNPDRYTENIAIIKSKVELIKASKTPLWVYLIPGVWLILLLAVIISVFAAPNNCIRGQRDYSRCLSSRSSRNVAAGLGLGLSGVLVILATVFAYKKVVTKSLDDGLRLLMPQLLAEINLKDPMVKWTHSFITLFSASVCEIIICKADNTVSIAAGDVVVPINSSEAPIQQEIIAMPMPEIPTDGFDPLGPPPPY